MVPSRRTHFSDDDIKRLTGYLAVYTADDTGRAGNKVYKELVENEEGKWPWSARHPWQSWRDRYQKNRLEFDRRIRKYQREKGIVVKPPSSPQRPNSSQVKGKRKASGNLEDSHAAKRSKHSERSPVNDGKQSARNGKPNRDKTRRILSSSETDDDDDASELLNRNHKSFTKNEEEEPEMPQAQDDDGVSADRQENNEDSGAVADMGVLSNGKSWERSRTSLDVSGKAANGAGPSLSASSNHALVRGAPVKPKPKPKRRPNPQDEDPFLPDSPVANAGSGSTPKPSRKLPQFREGPFRSTLDVGQPRWPPARNKKRGKAPSSAAPENSASTPMAPANVTPSRHTNATSNAASPRRSVPQYVVGSAIASSSKSQLPPSKYKSIDDAISPQNPKSTTIRNEFENFSSNDPFNASPIVPSPFKQPKINVSAAVQSASLPVNGEEPDEIPVHTADSPKADAGPSRRASEGSPTLINGSNDIHPTDLIDLNPNHKPDHPRKRPLVDEVRKRLHSIAGAATEIPHIDLRDLSITSSSRRQSSVSTRGSVTRRRSSMGPPLPSPPQAPPTSSPYKSKRSSSMASTKEEMLFQDVGQKLLGTVAQRYGFDVSVALKAYEKFKDLDETGAFLSKLRDKAALASLDLMRKMRGGADEDAESESDSASDSKSRKKRDDCGPVKKRNHREAQIHERRDSRASGSGAGGAGPRHSLTIRPIPNENDGNMSDYTPPRRSRAGRYTRKHGRDSLGGGLTGLARLESIMPFSQTTTPNFRLESHRRRARSSSRRVSGPGRQLSTLRGRLSYAAEQSPDSSPTRPSQNSTVPPSSALKGNGDPPPADDSDDEAEEEEEEEEEEREAEGEHEGGGGRVQDDELYEEEEFLDVDEDLNGSRTEVEDELIDGDESSMQVGSDNEDVAPPSAKDFFAALPPHQLQKQRELINFATTVNQKNAAKMRAWEAEQDPELLREHQAFLLETLRLRIDRNEPSPFNFDSYFEST